MGMQVCSRTWTRYAKGFRRGPDFRCSCCNPHQNRRTAHGEKNAPSTAGKRNRDRTRRYMKHVERAAWRQEVAEILSERA